MKTILEFHYITHHVVLHHCHKPECYRIFIVAHLAWRRGIWVTRWPGLQRLEGWCSRPTAVDLLFELSSISSTCVSVHIWRMRSVMCGDWPSHLRCDAVSLGAGSCLARIYSIPGSIYQSSWRQASNCSETCSTSGQDLVSKQNWLKASALIMETLLSYACTVFSNPNFSLSICKIGK